MREFIASEKARLAGQAKPEVVVLVVRVVVVAEPTTAPQNMIVDACRFAFISSPIAC